MVGGIGKLGLGGGWGVVSIIQARSNGGLDQVGSVEVLRGEAEWNVSEMTMPAPEQQEFYPAEDNCGQSTSEKIGDLLGRVTVRFWTRYIQTPVRHPLEKLSGQSGARGGGLAAEVPLDHV